MEIAGLKRRRAEDRAALCDRWVSIPREALLEYLPFRYDDLRFPTPARVSAKAREKRTRSDGSTGVKERRVRGLEIVEVRCATMPETPFTAKWIGRNRYVFGRFRDGMRLFVRGRVERNFTGPTVNVAHYAQLAEDERYRGELVPVYRASKESGQPQDRDGGEEEPAATAGAGAARSASAGAGAATWLPCAARRLSRRARAADPEEAELARASVLSLPSFWRWRRARNCAAPSASAITTRARSTCRPTLLERLEESLPFALTGAQRRVIREIWDDMRRDVPMNRLLARRRRQRQDVGRGGRDPAGGGQRYAVGADGADRAAGVAARRANWRRCCFPSASRWKPSSAVRARARASAALGKARQRRGRGRGRNARAADRGRRLRSLGPRHHRRAASLRRRAARACCAPRAARRTRCT